MNILLEIDSDAFMIFARNGTIFAHHIRAGRDYLLASIAHLHPEGVRRALESLVANEALPRTVAQRFEEQHLPWPLKPMRQAA